MNITRQVALIAVASTMVIVGNGSARAQTIDWVRQFGSTGSDFAYDVAVDTAGNVYVVGDGGVLPGEVEGWYLARFDVAGNLVWVRPVRGVPPGQTLKSTGFAYEGLATDRASFVYVAGWSEVAKYDASGVQQWARTFDLPGSIDEVGTGVATDLAGDAYVVGRALRPTSIGFLGKYDPSGTQLWFHPTGGESPLGAPSYIDIATADTGHFYIAGANPGSRYLIGSTVSVRQYDLAGNAGWAGVYGQQMYDAQAGAVTTDTSGNIYVAGVMGHLYLPSEPGSVLLIRFDTGGNRLWVQTLPFDVFGGAPWPVDVAADSQGNVYLVGGATIVAFDSAGTQLWARQIGDPQTDLITSVAVDVSGAIYLTGYTTGALLGETPLGGEDAFIVKLTPPTNRVGYYEIVSRSSDKCLDVYGASTDAAASVIQWVCHGGQNQQWRIEPAGGGAFRIIARHSGQALDVYGALLDDVTPIIQWPVHGGDNQAWTLEPAGDGYLRIVARHSGKALDVEFASTDDGARVIQYTPHGGANQQWLLRQSTAAPWDYGNEP